jgi:hypothetical protein
MLSMHDEPHYARLAMAHGAACYLTKGATPAELYDAMRTILSGRQAVADNAKGVLSESGRTKPDGSELNIYKTLFNVLPSVRIISLMMDDDTEAFRSAVEAEA